VKLIVAYTKPEMLMQVKRALLAADFTKFSVTNALGVGAEPGIHEYYRGAEVEVDLLKKVRLEIAVDDKDVEPVCRIIADNARTPEPDRTGDHGDGKIFILQLHDVVRIRTGERGAVAIR
jgi:nitrogen regulatory protein P-II 1